VGSDGNKLFELLPDDSYDNLVEARHRWGLPGVKCDSCGATWANVGIAYPTADLSLLGNLARFTKSPPVPWAEFEELRRLVLPHIPPGAPTPPGTGLGPLHGKARGSFADVVWPSPWTVLIREQALIALRKSEVRPLNGAVSHLRGPADLPALVELELEPRGRLAAGAHSAALPCAVCGRQPVTRPSDVTIERSSIPDDRDIFRLTDLTTMIVGTERAVRAFADLRLTGYRVRELALGG